MFVVVATQARSTEPHSNADPVTRAQARPDPGGTTVLVSTDADADTPFYFKSADFPFTDADGDSLTAVIIESVPSAGTLRVDATAITSSTVPQTVTVGTIPTLNYYPEPGQEPTDPDNPLLRYTNFRFKVMDDGSGETVSINSVRLNIRLVAPAQVAASGNPTTQPLITAENPTYMVGTQLTATTSGIVEPNDINRETLRWEWQSSSASDGTFTAIASATAITFTPTQALAGQYLRFCVRFMDRHATPVQEGPLCSIGARVTNAGLRLRLRLFLEGPLR